MSVLGFSATFSATAQSLPLCHNAAVTEPQPAEMKAITIRVPAAVHHEARVLSVQRGESLNAVLSKLLERWIAYAKENAK
jgi:predicted HicB family RNase H-like nuclease